MPEIQSRDGSLPILVVDDEQEVRALLRKCMEQEGFSVLEARDGRELKAALAAGPVQLITLDLNLAGEDGLVLAREIRAACNVPIVMITGKGDTIDRVVGLELGADDYITKPFHVREVLARIRAVLRRYEGSVSAPRSAQAASPGDGESCHFANLVLNEGRRELKTTDGSTIDLTTAEFNLLALMVRHPQRVLSRDVIMDRLKGHDWSPLDRTIDALVARVRKKIEPNNETPKILKTVRGVGYVLAAEVRRV